MGLVDSHEYIGCCFAVLTNPAIVYDGPISCDSALHNEKYNDVNGEGNVDGELYNCLRNRGVEGFMID